MIIIINYYRIDGVNIFFSNMILPEMGSLTFKVSVLQLKFHNHIILFDKILIHLLFLK